jgi:hypothetical protein
MSALAFGFLGAGPKCTQHHRVWSSHPPCPLATHLTEQVRYYGPRFGAGDTVGCGLDYARKEIFFTLNGQYLGPAFENVIAHTALYPTVGIDSRHPVSLNFGESPFAFDLDAYQELRGAKEAEVEAGVGVGVGVGVGATTHVAPAAVAVPVPIQQQQPPQQQPQPVVA